MTDWDLSRPDWQDRIRAGASLLPDLPLFEAEARRAVGVFNKLRIPDVVGMPAMKDAAGDWFREIVAALFGSLDPTSGQRLIREAFVLVPKKNSKTTSAAGLMLTALLLNKRPRAELILTGPTQEVSDLAFSQVEGMIAADPEGFLQKRMHVQGHLKSVTDRHTRATLRIKTFDSSVATGPKPVAILIDELHETSKMSNAAGIIGQLRGGMISQPEAFLMFITTQSDRPPAGAFAAELRQARAIRDGRLKGVPMLPVLYEFPPDMIAGGDGAPWRDPATWRMVTPNRNRSVRIERLVSDFAAAEDKGPAEITRWASQHLNIEIGLALSTDRWAGAKYWERGADPTLTLPALLDRSEVVIVGIDGGGLDDLFGLAVLGREKSRGEGADEVQRWLLWSHAWCHQGVLEERKSIAQQLRDFERAGELTIVDDKLQDLSEIVAHVEAIKDRGLLAEVAVDPAGLGELVDALAAIGVTEERKTLVGVGQGYRLMNAIKTAERRLANGTLVHGGSKLMAHCVGNVKIEPTATAIRATKLNAGTAKIDPWAAAMNAVDRMSLNPKAKGRGILSRAALWA